MDDCAIIGGGPAGLTAAVYLARFGLAATVYDAGASRAATIPCTRNAPGFPDGIPGVALLDRMRAHADRYGAHREEAEVTALTRAGDAFRLEVEGREATARAVLIATGVVNHRPAMPDALHDRGVAEGLIRYCPVCDGYEVTDRRVAVVGRGRHGAREALFLRGYTREVTLVGSDGELDLDAACERELDQANVRRLDGPCGNWALEDGQVRFDAGGERVTADVAYPAMGSAIRSELAVSLGARANGEGCLEVDEHGSTSVAGLYAAGDVVRGLDQISHAAGQAAVAATAIRNRLDRERPIRR